MSARAPADIAVDIVVNNYNYGRFLAEAVESACRQTHPSVSVIAVDDGSSDDSRQILAAFEDRIAVVLKENGGQASAINAGLDLCEGDVVIFLDADDVLHREAATRAAAAFAADDAVAKVQFRMDVIDAAGNPTGELKPPPRLPMPAGDLRVAELNYPFDLAWLPTSANAFRLEALRQILPIPEADYPVCGADWYLLHLGTLLGTVVSLEEVSCSYRVHGANNYEQDAAELNLDHVRDTIRFARSTSASLLDLADRMELPHPDRILSIADLGNRLVSLRLAPSLHPIPDDRAPALVLDAVRAARRRGNVSPLMRLMFVAWFGAMALAPPPLARRLGAWFLLPQRRTSLNHLFGRLQRGRRAGAVSSA